MPTNLYGQGDNYHHTNSHVLPAMISKFYDAKIKGLKKVICWGTGNPYREFLHVNDLAEACIFALEKWNPLDANSPKDKFGNTLYWLNVGCSTEISIKNVVEKISNFVGYHGEILWDETKPDGTPRKILDTSRMRKLGWESKIDLDLGIKLTLKAYYDEIKRDTLRNV